MAGRSRIVHSRTRNSCIRCKQRRVRCNLQTPICGNCTRRNEVCEYQARFSDQTHYNTFPAIESVPRLTYHNSINPGGLIQAFRIMLLVGNTDDIWISQFAPELEKYPFFNHNLLAVAAVHSNRHSNKPSAEPYISAIAHHLESSRLFRDSITKITENNWIAALGFALATVVLHFTIARPQSAARYNFLQMFLVLRSTAQLSRAVQPFFLPSKLMLQIKELEFSEAHELDKSSDIGLLNLSLLVSTNKTEEVNLKAIQLLEKWIRMCGGCPQTQMRFMWWPANVSSDYVNSLEAKDPLSIVIFIYWCAFMNNTPPWYWFLDGWAFSTAVAAMDSLGPEWNNALEWPRDVFGISESRLSKLTTIECP